MEGNFGNTVSGSCCSWQGTACKIDVFSHSQWRTNQMRDSFVKHVFFLRGHEPLGRRHALRCHCSCSRWVSPIPSKHIRAPTKHWFQHVSTNRGLKVKFYRSRKIYRQLFQSKTRARSSGLEDKTEKCPLRSTRALKN